MDTLLPLYAQIARRFAEAFPEQRSGLRTVGREAEYPVVTADGQAADVRTLWAPLARGGDFVVKREEQSDLIVGLQGTDFSYALEVGLGTVEINTRPCQDLFELAEVQVRAVSLLVEVAALQGYRILGFGIQPRTGPSLALMSPKERYQVLYQVMGEDWLWYTVTASEQAQIDIRRSEWLAMVNLGNLLAPVFIALCGNSPVWGDSASRYCSAREGHMAQIRAGEHRHGMIARPFSGAQDFVATLSQATCLMLPGPAGFVRPGISFADYLRRYGGAFEEFLYHEHYIWNSARARAAYGTIELRPACQQPWPEHMSATALALGLVENWAAIREYVTGLWPDPWPPLRGYHRQAIWHGLAAAEPADGFLTEILNLVEEGLYCRGRGEESFLSPLRRRLDRGRNPAQDARDLYSRHGMQALIDYADVATHLAAGSG